MAGVRPRVLTVFGKPGNDANATSVDVRSSVAHRKTLRKKKYALLAASGFHSSGSTPSARSNVLFFVSSFLRKQKKKRDFVVSCFGFGGTQTGRLTVAPRPRVGFFPLGKEPRKDYLVDPASSHMLVSKIKPCMSKYMPKQGETANGSLNQLWFLRSFLPTWITVAILELIHAVSPKPFGATGAFIRPRSIGLRSVLCGDSG